MADITLPQQPVFNIARSFFDKVVPGTLINGEVHFSSEQCADLMGITLDNWHQRMIRRTATENSSTYLDDRYCSVYVIPVFYPPRADGTGGGGLKPTHFHHHKKVLAEAMSIRDKQKREPLVFWLVDVGSQVIQNGFAIDQHALQHDPAVILNFAAKTRGANFSDIRQDFAGLWHLLAWAFRHCSDTLQADGKVSPVIVNEFMRSTYNSLYVSATGCSGKWIRDARANQAVITFGQKNYRGKYSPWNSELGTMANFFYDSELRICLGSAQKGVGFILEHVRVHGSITWTAALQHFSMGCHSHHTLSYGSHYTEWPKTLPDIKTPVGSAPYLMKRQEFLKNFPNRHKPRSMEEAAQNIQLSKEIMYEAISSVDIHGNIIDDDDLLSEYGYVPRHGHMPPPQLEESRAIASRVFYI